MEYFDQRDLKAFDLLLKDIEQNAQDNTDLVDTLAKSSIAVKGDLSAMLAADPQSDAYMEFVKSVHEEIIGQKHAASMEGLPVLNLEYEKRWPYPWGTKSATTVGRFLIAYGFLLKIADLPPGARILEVGCGMGSLTWNLARMGYRVDALDPNPTQCEFVEWVTRDFPVRPKVIANTLDQWLARKTEAYKYDAVIFFESFHHVIDHRECIRGLLDGHMEVDAKLMLAAEPVYEEACETLPYPWGPRLDGESLRAMRKWGWLELGFTQDYLKSLFSGFGLAFEWFRSDAAGPHSQVICGTRLSHAPGGVLDAEPRYASPLAAGIDFSLAGLPASVLECRGLSAYEGWGRWSVGRTIRIRFRERLPATFSATLHLVSVFGPNVHKKLTLKAGRHSCSEILEEIESRTTYRFDFDGVDSDMLEISIPHPFRPKDIPEIRNEDPRKIGIALKAITFA